MSAGWRLVQASTDAVPASIRRFFQTRRPARPRRRARPFALAGAVLVLAATGVWVVAGTSLFGVREVRVTGTAIVTPAQVREAAAVPDRTPLLRVPSGEVADRVTGALAPVARVTISRDWPDALVLAVTERTPVAAVPVGEAEFRLVDAGGVAFHTVLSAPPDLPLVMVDRPGPDDPDTQAALAVLAALTPALRQDLATLSVTGPAAIELSLHSDRTIRWGDATRSDDKARVAAALLDQASERGLAVIDVSSPEVVAMR